MSIASARDFLSRGNRTLTVVLFPTGRSLLSDEGSLPRQAPSVSSARLTSAAELLEARGIQVINLLAVGYDAVWNQHVCPKYTFYDGIHYVPSALESLSRVLLEDIRKKSGGSLFLGDCFAEGLASTVRNCDDRAQLKLVWKNGGAHLMAHELAHLSPLELEGVKNVYWFIGDTSLDDEALSFPPCVPDTRALSDEFKIETVELVENSFINEPVLRASPYTEALIIHKFRLLRSDEVLLGIIQVMHQHKIDPAIKQWKKGDVFRMNFKDWNEACETNRSLRSILMVDDTQDFESARYFILAWSHVD